MKTIVLKNNASEENKNNTEKPKKIREKIMNLKTNNDTSTSNIILNCIQDHSAQITLINKLYLGEDFPEKKFILRELNAKLNSYKHQDIKKDFHEEANLITLDNIIEKLVSCKLKCYYCNNKLVIIFDKVRDNDQWTLDRINNYDEHTNNNTVISCLQCNLQRRRKNSEKFKFTKQLENKHIKINKLTN